MVKHYNKIFTTNMAFNLLKGRGHEAAAAAFVKHFAIHCASHFHTAGRKHIVQSGNHSKAVHNIFRLNAPQIWLSDRDTPYLVIAIKDLVIMRDSLIIMRSGCCYYEKISCNYEECSHN